MTEQVSGEGRQVSEEQECDEVDMSNYSHLKLLPLRPFLRPGEGQAMQPSLCSLWIQLYKRKTTEGILKTQNIWLKRQVSYRVLRQGFHCSTLCLP